MKNEKKELLKKAATGDAETMYLLAQDYENEGNFDNAFFWYNKTAIQGLADGINNVAMYYLEGLVVPPDVDKTINLLESIADKIPVAKINLACIYLEEKGCPQDSEKGMELLQHAVSGEGPAAFTIGKIHLGGTGDRCANDIFPFLRIARVAENIHREDFILLQRKSDFGHGLTP